jgi:hypothetical protein
LEDLRRLLIKEKQWLKDEDRDVKKIWEGLFFSKFLISRGLEKL